MLRAIILIGLVGQAAADIKCKVDTAEAPCAADKCWTHTATSGAVITRGCGGETSGGGGATCDKDTGKCVMCITDREGGCNSVGNAGKSDFQCVVANGLDAKATACAEPTCWTHTSKADKPVITRGCGTGVTESVQCHTDRPLGCNLEGGPADWKCWVGDIKVGVVNVNGAGEVCTAPTDKCYTRTMKDPTTTVDKGCGPCVPGNDYTCSSTDGEKECGTNVANGCNEPIIQICFVGNLESGKAENCLNGVLECYTKTLTAVPKTPEFGCGPCDPGNDHTCSADAAVMDCQNIVPAGCNEPPRFQCIVGVDKPDTTAAEDCMPNPYTALHSCTKIVKSVDGEDDVITKACDVCPAKGAEVAGEKCYACDKTGCNSASGLFSVLALTLAVIYQLA